MSMRSMRLTAFGAPLVEEASAEPVPEGREVVLKVEGCGVCHTDLHLHEGHYDLGGGNRLDFARRGLEPPLTLGHEVAGRVVAVGPEAEGEVEIGASRLVFPWIGCGACATCRTGTEQLCNRPRFVGVFRPGGYADRVVVPDPRYLLAIDGLDPALAATYACSGVTAYAALRKALPVATDSWIAVVGCGGVGQAAIGIAKVLTEARVIAVDLDAAKRETAATLGADAVLDPAEGPAALAEACGGRLSAAVDFVGGEASAALALGALAKGGRYVIVGLYGGELRTPLPPIPLRMISIIGSYVGTLADLREVLALARGGMIPPTPVATRPLAQANEALADLRAGRVAGRVVLVP